MSQFPEMEWSTRWDWENIVSFGSRVTESPRKQLMECMVYDKDETFNLSTSSANNSCEGGHNSSAKSSISASTDSSTKYDVQQMPNFGFRFGNWSNKVASCVGVGEKLIGLKLGKRTYFENSVNSTSFAVMPSPSSGALNKNKTVSCQVQGCNTDLSNAKDYHKKHKVCDNHSKCPKVIVGGLERRFCQQCSRFHSLSEFDKKKRSCRKRLSDHNARRRKPQQQIIQFNSPRLSSTFNGGGFLLNSPPPVGPITPANSVWDSTRPTKFTLTKGTGGDGRSDEQLHVLGVDSPHIINMTNETSGLSASNNSTFQAFNPVSKGSMNSSSLDAAAPHRALSLLSSEPEPTSFQSVMHDNGSSIGQPMVHAVAVGVPSLMHSANLQSLSMSSNLHLFREPYEANYESNSSIY